MNPQPAKLGYIPWIISAAATVLAVVIWGQPHSWQLTGSNYGLFPLFGLVAFSLMWSHYAADFLKTILGVRASGPYFPVTSYVVLVALLLHPGLLAWQLWRDGRGLPPMSELHYVAPALEGAIILAMVAWLAFLAFELYRWFGERSWWRFVGYANEVAMFLIIYHSLSVGSDVQMGWQQLVWYFYAGSLAVFLLYKYAAHALLKE